MNTTKSVLLEYIHQLNEDIEENLIRKGVSLRITSTPDKLESYSAFTGKSFIEIPSEKVQILKRTTTVETMLLEGNSV